MAELDNADNAVIEGLESYLEPIDPKEIQYLEDLLRRFDNTCEDTKCAQFITTLRQELNERESAVNFRQIRISLYAQAWQLVKHGRD